MSNLSNSGSKHDNVWISPFSGLYTSYSGVDIIATMSFGIDSPRVIGSLSTISYSIQRETTPVYTLGRFSPKGVTRGKRIIAGTLIFNVFDSHEVRKIFEEWYEKNIQAIYLPEYMRQEENLYQFEHAQGKITEVSYTQQPSQQKTQPTISQDIGSSISLYVLKNLNILPDMMPPFDVTLYFHNEYGSSSYLQILGIVLMSEGQVMSVNDIYTENTMSYIAHDIRLLESGTKIISRKERRIKEDDNLHEIDLKEYHHTAQGYQT